MILGQEATYDSTSIDEPWSLASSRAVAGQVEAIRTVAGTYDCDATGSPSDDPPRGGDEEGGKQ